MTDLSSVQRKDSYEMSQDCLALMNTYTQRHALSDVSSLIWILLLQSKCVAAKNNVVFVKLTVTNVYQRDIQRLPGE